MTPGEQARARRAAAIWAALPPAPWPSRWAVEPGATGYSYVVVLSGSARREVRVGANASLGPHGVVLKDVPGEGEGASMVGIVTVVPGPGGLGEACEDARRLALAHLVMES